MKKYKNELNIIMYNIRVNKETGCWEYKKKLNDSGYGVISYKSKNWLIHRLSYTLFIDDIDKGKIICHKCDNPRCCNPEHLFQGTRADNIKDMISKGRAFFQKSEDEKNLAKEKTKEKQEIINKRRLKKEEEYAAWFQGLSERQREDY